MARLLAAFLLASVLYVTTNAQVLCPKSQPATATQTCTDDPNCPQSPVSQICCTYGSNKRCVNPVIPNYQAVLYIAGLPQLSNENTLLQTYIEQKFSAVGVLGDLEVERFGTCVKVFMHLNVNDERAADVIIVNMERQPVAITSFSGGPFYVTSQRNETLCPSAIPNFYTRLFIKNVDKNVTVTLVKNKLSSLIGNTGKGWEFGNSTMTLTVGSCMEVFLEAVLTPQEMTTVSNVLTNLEQNGLTLTLAGKDVTYGVTSSIEDAAPCFENFYQNQCGQGQQMCTSVKKCVPTSAICDGVNDCGDFSDESDCSTGTPGTPVQPPEPRQPKTPTEMTTEPGLPWIPAGPEFPVLPAVVLGCDIACSDNVTQCLTLDMVCDDVRDCRDASDETNCHFETYTVNVTSVFPWNDYLQTPGSEYYNRIAGLVKSFANNAFRPITGYAYSDVQNFKQVSAGVTMTLALTFRGAMAAENVTLKLSEILASGIVSGIVHFAVKDIVPAMTGVCNNYNCSEGMCVVVARDGQAACRCLPGQEGPNCAAFDCRGRKSYCGTLNSKACVFVPHMSAYTCQCPVGQAGTTCDVNVCNLMGNLVCSSGYCIGDLYNYAMCQCDSTSFGPFCGDRFMMQQSNSMCLKQSGWATAMMDHMSGKTQVPSGFLNGKTLPERLRSLGYKHLAVPTCNLENGTYHHICVYNLTSVGGNNFCYCTDGNGTYNGKDYVDGQCKVPDTFDPEAKQGVCPAISSGGVEFGCLKDSDCQGTQKCCRTGVTRRCLSPLTGQWSTTSASPLPVTSARPLHNSSAPPSGNLAPAKSLDGTSSASSFVWINGGTVLQICLLALASLSSSFVSLWIMC